MANERINQLNDAKKETQKAWDNRYSVYRANVLNKSHTDKAQNIRKIEILQEEKQVISENINKLNIMIRTIP